jgi:hypothetical protein
MYHKQLHLLRLLLELTQSGRAVWRRENATTHRTEVMGYPCCVRFKQLVAAGGAPAAPDAVDVSVGLDTLMFYCGSEGYDLVEKVLKAAYPEVLQQAQQKAIRLDAMMVRMESAVV